MKNSNYILIFICALVFSSCAPRVQFTQSIKDQHQLKESELKSIQFYTTGDIMLQRMEASGSNKETNEGELVISSGSSLEQVFIAAGTPGLVDQIVNDNSFKVRFEVGEGKTLLFGNNSANKGAYYLLPSEMKGSQKIVDYEGKKFVVSGNSSYVTLTFKMRKLNRFEKEARKVKGMKL